MQRLSILALIAVLVTAVSCGSDSPSTDSNNDSWPEPSATEFFEPAPDAAAVQLHIQTLLTEFEPLVDADTRASVEAYALPFGPTALNAPANTVDAYLAVGESAFMMGSASGATWAFLKALELNLEDIYVLSQLGFVLSYEGRYHEGRVFLLFAESLEEDLHTVFINLAQNYDALEEPERCIYWLERAAILQPDNGDIRHMLAKCYFRAGLDLAGQSALEEALSLAPYGSESISQTSADPPQEVIDAFGEPPATSSNAGDLIGAVGACQLQLVQDFTEHVAPYTGAGGAFMSIEGTLTHAVDLNAGQRQVCLGNCPPGPEQDACIAGCLAAECLADSGAFASFRRDYLSARSNWSGKDAFVTSGFAGCAWPPYFRLAPTSVSFERESAKTMIWSQLDGAQESRGAINADIDETILLWEEDIASICTDAESAIADVDWLNANYFDPFKDLDIKICSPLLDSFCLHITNTKVSVTTPIVIGSPANLEFSIDARTGKFDATVTVPLASRSTAGGTVEGGANLKFNMEKGVGIQGEGKVGGPLNKTWSTERWLFSNW